MDLPATNHLKYVRSLEAVNSAEEKFGSALCNPRDTSSNGTSSYNTIQFIYQFSHRGFSESIYM